MNDTTQRSAATHGASAARRSRRTTDGTDTPSPSTRSRSAGPARSAALAPSKRIERELRALLANPELKAHAPFFSEVELCGRFKVNVATVRKAVRVLVEDGLIYKRHRVGTFVAPTSRTRLILLVSTNPEYSFVGRLTPVTAKYSRLQWQEVFVEDIRANLEHIKLVYPRLAGALFVRDLPKCIDVIRGLQTQGIPVCFYGSDAHASFLHQTNSLLYREEEITGLALDHLATAGAKAIGFIGSDDWTAFSARHAHFLQWHRDRERPVAPANLLIMPHVDLMNPVRCFEVLKSRLRTKGFTADAVFCSTTASATILIQAALACGYAVPKDLQVVGVEDDELLSTHSFPQITAVQHPFTQDIQEAFDLLTHERAAAATEYAHLTSRSRLVIRQSTLGG